MSRRQVRTAVALIAVLALPAVAATPAFAHATISPTQVQPGAEVDLTVQSIVEREALINERMQVLVPRQWRYLSCTAPALWTCSADAKSFAPHTVVTYVPAALATPLDITFTLRVKAPAQQGVYLFRSIQTHADGWNEPWVYGKEPYVAPPVQVGGVTKVVNPDGSKEDPRCFGPTKQPADYASHDGSAGDPKPCVRTGKGGQTLAAPAPDVRVSASRETPAAGLALAALALTVLGAGAAASLRRS